MKIVSVVTAQLKRLKARLGSLWWHSALLFIVRRFADVVSLVIGTVLVPAALDQARLGAILPLTRLVQFVSLPQSIVLAGAKKYITVFAAKGERGKVKALLRDLAGLTSLLSIGAVAYLWFARGFILTRLRLEDPNIVWVLAGLIVISCWRPAVSTAIQGTQEFRRLILSRLLGPVVRLIAILFLLERFQIMGYVGANLVAGGCVVLFLSRGLHRYVAREVKARSYHKELREMARYLVPVGLSLVALTGQGVIEPWVIRQRLSSIDSAGYYMAFMFGNIPVYFASSIYPFLFPVVSTKFEKGKSTRRIHAHALIAVVLSGSVTTLLLLLFGEHVLGFREAWSKFSSYSCFLWQVGLVTTLTTVMNVHLAHENACRQFRYLTYLLPLVFIESALLYGLTGWGFFQPYLPSGVWNYVHSNVPITLQSIMILMLASRILIVLGIAVEVAMSNRRRDS